MNKNFGLVVMSIGMFIGLAGCASHAHLYGPLAESEKIEGGTLRFRSQGVVDLRVKGTKDRRPALHIRATLVNNSSAVWLFEPKEQAVLYPDQGRASAVDLNAQPIQIEAGESRTADLYFFMPADEANLKEFDIQWKLRAGEKAIASTVAFTQLKERSGPGYYPYSGFGAGFYDWGPRYYYQPSIRVRR